MRRHAGRCRALAERASTRFGSARSRGHLTVVQNGGPANVQSDQDARPETVQVRIASRCWGSLSHKEPANRRVSITLFNSLPHMSVSSGSTPPVAMPSMQPPPTHQRCSQLWCGNRPVKYVVDVGPLSPRRRVCPLIIAGTNAKTARRGGRQFLAEPTNRREMLDD
jgi:hypothetical protein